MQENLLSRKLNLEMNISLSKHMIALTVIVCNFILSGFYSYLQILFQSNLQSHYQLYRTLQFR